MSVRIDCPKCNAVIAWNGTDDIVFCRLCGTRYKMHPRRSSNTQPAFMPPVGRGEVDILTVPNESTIRNRPLLKTYIPNNWRYQCTLAGDRFDVVSNPFVVSVAFLAPDNSAKIVFTGECFYKHFNATPQTAAFQNRLDDLTVSRTPSFLRLKSYMPANAYCDALAGSCGLNGLSVVNTRQPDSTELTKQQNAVQSFLSKGFLNASADWAGKTYSGTAPNGQRMKVYAETRVIQMMKVSQVPTLQMPPLGGMGALFGARMTPQMVAQQRQDIFWDTQYEFTLLAAEAVFDRAYAELQRIMQTLDYLPEMAQARADAMALANNAMMNIAAARSDSMNRMSQTIAETNAYTSNIQHQMIANNAASHDRVANLNSEMIRGVNTYHAHGGVVEASTMYDHVYQNTQNPNLFAAQQGDSFEFGVDFEELPRTNGNY